MRFILYLLIVPIVFWAINGLNMNNIFKKNKYYEARIIYLILGLIVSYLLVGFVESFIEATSFFKEIL